MGAIRRMAAGGRQYSLADFNLVVCYRSAKLKSPPNLPAIIMVIKKKKHFYVYTYICRLQV